MTRGTLAALGFTALMFATSVDAHQPVMDMAPRWKGGYGTQVRHVWHGSDTLKDGDADVANPSGRRRRVNTTWVEGVYTFSKEARVTMKLPWINQSRVIVKDGVRRRQADSGDADGDEHGEQLDLEVGALANTAGNHGATALEPRVQDRETGEA